MRIYVASSWRNRWQPQVVETLRTDGHEVYDFRNPALGVGGFAWSDIDPDWQSWTTAQYLVALDHPVASEGFGRDMEALRACEVCVLVLPCGRSAHLELGVAIGMGKRTAILRFEENEPELMYAAVDLVTDSPRELLEACRTRWPRAGRLTGANLPERWR